MIRVEGIRKVFNAHTRSANEVLKGVSFELPDRGLVAIFGKSGSGKTTLLNIMGGLDRQDAGHIYIDNEDVAGKVDHVRNAKIGFIFQNYYLEAGYTVEEIMHNAMVIAGFKDEEEIRSRVEQVLTLVKMDRYKHKTADALSGGQKQRVAIARALVKGSDIILADEPTGNLDSENTTITMDILKEISKTQLVVLVTHEVNLIYKYADSHIKLVDGELREDGELDEEIEVDIEEHNIYANSENKRTYNIGNTNIDVYGDSENSADIELFNEDGTVYLRPIKNVKIIDANSEKKVIFEGSEEEKPEIAVSVPKFAKSTATENGRLFSFANICQSHHYAGGEKAYSTGNIFKQIFILALAVVMCFFSYFVFEAASSKCMAKPTDASTVYMDMRTYPEIRKLDEDLYNSIDFFELNYNDGTFAFSNQQSMSAISVKYAPKSLDLDATADSSELIFGAMPEDGEVLVTRRLAEDLKFALRHDEYQTDEALLLLMLDKKYKISGIVEGAEPYVYMKRADYVNFLGVYKDIKLLDSTNKFFEKAFVNKDTGETINSYRAEIRLYTGDTLELENNEAVIEINRSSTYLMMTDTKDADYRVDLVNRILLKHPQHISIVNSYPMYIRQFALNREEMSTDIRVYVNKHTLANIFAYIAPNLDALDTESSYFFEVTTDSEEQLARLNTRLQDRGVIKVDIDALYAFENREANNAILSNILIFILVAILLFTIYYFIEKSGSIKNSKEYGIFRAIGVNKSNLLYKEVVLTLKDSIITYVVGYLVVMAIMCIRYAMMNVMLGVFIGIALGIMLLSALIMVLISLIPYLFVLVKTPSEILSKYDI